MDLMIDALIFIIGFLTGGILVYFVFTKHSAHHKLQDEVTKLKRALASKERMANEFFDGLDTQFRDLTKAYTKYAKFIQESSLRFNSETSSDLEEIIDSYSSKKPLKKDKKAVDKEKDLKENKESITSANETLLQRKDVTKVKEQDKKALPSDADSQVKAQGQSKIDSSATSPVESATQTQGTDNDEINSIESLEELESIDLRSNESKAKEAQKESLKEAKTQSDEGNLQDDALQDGQDTSDIVVVGKRRIVLDDEDNNTDLDKETNKTPRV